MSEDYQTLRSPEVNKFKSCVCIYILFIMVIIIDDNYCNQYLLFTNKTDFMCQTYSVFKDALIKTQF